MRAQGRITPWVDDDVPDELMPPETIPAPGTVVSEHQYEEPLNATELVLSNGMRVCFKCTDFFDDEVLLTGFAFGGLSEVSCGGREGGRQRLHARLLQVHRLL